MNCGKSIRGAVSYNENKVKHGSADLLFASNFACDIEDIGVTQKVNRFQKLTQLNEKIKTNTLHLSLNFPPEEKISDILCMDIAREYMDGIGFGDQPYLVYRHFDSGHPHIHIVATNIKSDGSAISMHNLAKLKSEPIRKEIEFRYNLIRAEERAAKEILPFHTEPLKAAQYGRSATKQKISNVVLEVIRSYKFSSLDELNSILMQFNVVAQKVSIAKNLGKHKGLIYSFIDPKGYKVGVPIKASEIYSKPTLEKLERKCSENMIMKMQFKRRVIFQVEQAKIKAKGLNQFARFLKEKRILSIAERNSAGMLSDLNFIDNATRTIFNYKEIDPTLLENLNLLALNAKPTAKELETNSHSERFDIDLSDFITHNSLLNVLLADHNSYNQPADNFIKKKRKKRKH